VRLPLFRARTIPLATGAIMALAACAATPRPSSEIPSAARSTPPDQTPPTASARGDQPSSGPPSGVAGDRIAFQANLEDDSTGIYLIGADGSGLLQVVDEPGVTEMDPVWSSDGRWIAYNALIPDGTHRGGVFIIDPSDPDAAPIHVTDQMAYGPPTWSPDGTLLTVGGDGSAGGIGVYDVETEELTYLTDDGGHGPRWSPDGTRIAYNALTDVRVVEVASGEVTPVTGDTWSDSVARWVDDSHLVIVSDRETTQARGSSRNWEFDLGTGELRPLDEPVIAFAHWPSPDGEWLAYALDGELRLSRADGSDDRVVFPTIPADAGPSWTTDSSAFVFSSAFDAPRDLYVMRVDEDAPEQLTTSPADESAPNWEPG
jgi:Tol biopolymer transport system component